MFKVLVDCYVFLLLKTTNKNRFKTIINKLARKNDVKLDMADLVEKKNVAETDERMTDSNIPTHVTGSLRRSAARLIWEKPSCVQHSNLQISSKTRT